MLRTLLVGILAVSATASCSKGGDAPKVQPGAPVGKVLELTGTVTATRGAEVRTLAAGGEISADDLIGTAADSRVAILVEHNNARWDLGPNKQARLAESIAWTAAKQDRPASAVIEETSTAGRHAERTAATTDTTTGEMVVESRKPAVVAPGGSPPPPAADPVPVVAVPAAEPSTAPPPPRTEPRSGRPAGDQVSEKKQDDGPGENERFANTRTAPTVGGADGAGDTESVRTPSADKGDDVGMSGNVGTLGIAAPPKPTKGSKAPRPVAPTPAAVLGAEVERTLTKERDAMRACLATPKLVVAISVVNGTYTISTTDAAATAAVRTCLARIAKRLVATTSTEPVKRTITLEK